MDLGTLDAMSFSYGLRRASRASTNRAPRAVTLSDMHARGERTRAPVLVLGVEHSGTSILYNMIARHPATTWFSQYSTRAGDVSGAHSPTPWRWVDRVGRRFAHHDWRKVVSGLRSRLAPRPTEGWEIWSEYLEREGPVDERAAALSEMVESFCTRVHRPVFVGKSPRLLRKLDVLCRMEPTPRGVHIVRDGRAVAVSLRKRLAAGDPDEEAWPKVAEYWVNSLERVRAVQSSVDVLVVRYEDLCTDVHGTLARVFRHVGLTTPASVFDALPLQLRSRNRPLTPDLAPAIADRVVDLQARHLDEFGYGPSRGTELRRAHR
jgi:hypothetical protein